MWYYCRVTRMLVSYDIVTHPVVAFVILQGHQNVGELRLKRLKVLYFAVELQGHQNVGELRQTKHWQKPSCNLLQGHQNVGELRLVLFAVYEQFSVLQGHQNVGELRHLNCCSVSYCNCFAFKMQVRYEIAMTAFIQ